MQCLPGAVPNIGGAGRRLRPLRQPRWGAGALGPGGSVAPRTRAKRAPAGAFCGAWRRCRTCALEWRPGPCRPGICHWRGLFHHLSRLQTRPLHRVFQSGGRGHGDRGHRGHLQLLQLQGQDRHRPLLGCRASQCAHERRGGGPRHHRRVRFANAVAGWRAPLDRGQQKRRPRHGGDDGGLGQQTGGVIDH